MMFIFSAIIFLLLPFISQTFASTIPPRAALLPSSSHAHSLNSTSTSKRSGVSLFARDGEYVETGPVANVPYLQALSDAGNRENIQQQIAYQILQFAQTGTQSAQPYWAASTNLGAVFEDGSWVTLYADVNNYDAFNLFASDINNQNSIATDLAQYILDEMVNLGQPAVCALFYNSNGWVAEYSMIAFTTAEGDLTAAARSC